jgi:Uma2 family endonuclease
LVLDPPLTDGELEAHAMASELFRLERNREGEILTGFPRLCSDFVIELLSPSDSVPKARQKMERWIENGAGLGWLIDPYRQKVYVYEPEAEVTVVSGKTVHGSGPVEGFNLDLDELWRRYEI